MAINRYDNPQIFKYESQFVPTELPWELIQNKADVKKKERDDFKTDLSKAADVKPIGLDATIGHWAQTMPLNDYQDAISEINKYNEDLQKVSKEFSNSELNSDIYNKYTELSKQRNEIEANNAKRKARMDAVISYEKERVEKKVNPGDYRDIHYQIEMDRMANDKNYVPTSLGIQDAFDPTAFVNKAMTGINSEVLKEYINSSGHFLVFVVFQEDY